MKNTYWFCLIESVYLLWLAHSFRQNVFLFVVVDGGGVGVGVGVVIVDVLS